MIGAMIAMLAAVAFGAPGGRGRYGGNRRRGGGRGRMPPVLPQKPVALEAMDPSSLTMTMHIQMPLTATEMFLSSSATGPSWALWLIKIDTLSPAGEYHPHLMRLVKAASDGTPPVYLPSAPPAVAPRINMKYECRSRVSGETLRRTEVADGPLFLVRASATPGLSHQIGPDQFGSPEEIIRAHKGIE